MPLQKVYASEILDHHCCQGRTPEQYPDSQGEAAGLRAGDIVVSYGGRETTTRQALRDATGSAVGDEPVPVVVVRDGGTVTLHVRPGSLGVYGRPVAARRDE